MSKPTGLCSGLILLLWLGIAQAGFISQPVGADSIGPPEIDETANYAWSGTHSIRKGPNYCADAGSTDAYTCTITGLAALEDGLVIILKPNTNNTGAASINPSSLGVINIRKSDGITNPDNNELVAGRRYALYYDGTVFRMHQDSGGTTPTLDQVFDQGKVIDGANSFANAERVTDASGDGTVRYTDPTNGPVIDCVIGGVEGDCDKGPNVKTGFSYQIKVDGVVKEQITAAGVHTYVAPFRPKKTVYLDASYFSTDGTQCAAPIEAVLNTSKPKTWSITCADNDAGRKEAKVTMPAAWDGGTIRIRPSWFSQDAVATNIVQSWSGQCVRDGDPVANVATTGEQNATLTFESEANETQKAFTAAITLQGTCAGSATIFLTGDIDATGTTYVTMANARFLGAQIEYTVTSRSD